MRRKLTTVIALVLGLTLLLATPTFAHDGVGGDDLAEAGTMLIFAMFLFVVGCIWIYLSWRNGELRHPEKAKYTMLEKALVDEDGERIDFYAETEAQY